MNTKKNNGREIITTTVKGRKVDGIGKIYICNRCVITRFKHYEEVGNWAIFAITMIMGWPTVAFLLYTVFTHENTDLIRGIFVGTAVVLAILSVIWYFSKRSRARAKVKALEAMSDDDQKEMIEKPDSKDTDLIDGYTGDVLAIMNRKSELENKRLSPAQYGYYFLTRREYKKLSEAVDYGL